MTVKFSPWGNQQLETSAGVPAVGTEIFTYAAGSSELQTTYTSATGLTAQTNPVVCDSLGLPTGGEIWLTSGLSYKFVWKTAAGVTLRTIDNISGVNDTTTSVSQFQSSGVTPTYVSSISFTLAGDQTSEFHAKRKLQFSVTAGTVYGAILSSAYTTLTTVTMTMDSGNALDSGLSAVNLSILRADHLATPLNATPYVLTRRQTVLSGPVDSSGLPSFGGATGSATVTMTGTLVATCAAGSNGSGNVDRCGTISNASWTGLSTNGTMYLYLAIDANGTVTTGSSTLAPTYQWGGTYSTTNGQYTYNIQEATGKVGDGAAANQVYRVYVGEVTVAGAVVTAITWYAVMGRYKGSDTATPNTTRISKTHNIGVTPQAWQIVLQCQSADLNYAALDELAVSSLSDSSKLSVAAQSCNARTMGVIANTATVYTFNATGATHSALDTSKWDTYFYADRGW